MFLERVRILVIAKEFSNTLWVKSEESELKARKRVRRKGIGSRK
jgi:hypothetical protein